MVNHTVLTTHKAYNISFTFYYILYLLCGFILCVNSHRIDFSITSYNNNNNNSNVAFKDNELWRA